MLCGSLSALYICDYCSWHASIGATARAHGDLTSALDGRRDSRGVQYHSRAPQQHTPLAAVSSQQMQADGRASAGRRRHTTPRATCAPPWYDCCSRARRHLAADLLVGRLNMRSDQRRVVLAAGSSARFPCHTTMPPRTRRHGAAVGWRAVRVASSPLPHWPPVAVAVRALLSVDSSCVARAPGAVRNGAGLCGAHAAACS